MNRPSYRVAIEWVALNDEPDELDVDEMSGLISVNLVAYLFGKSHESVAESVVKYRCKLNSQGLEK